MVRDDDGYRKVLRDDQSLAIFLRNLRDFDRHFCELMAKGVDFTLTMQVRGNKGELLHVKVEPLSFDRPNGVEKRIEQRRGS